MTAPEGKPLVRPRWVAVGAVVRPAEDLRPGYFLAFERDRDQPFRIAPVQGEEYERGQRSADLVWGHVTGLDRLGSGGSWWKPSTFLLSVFCSFPADASLITTLFNHSPVLLWPRPSFALGGMVTL
ncbi:DUF2418 domain-containing protein [Streptosporangium sp. NBC_01755]|uniref:hypothetical protein n=1 Tax=Streptosporangium sp. NBC_01755 TaxID=2975949 RepID=UPI002DDADEDF|nr:hypothetical protein [Streptosporangium sp. NBC_01755]WSD02594.1 DUF2418 domain-containing protein [Streptosporangium sp. NBC_01755]